MASSARIDELLKKFEENPRRYFAPLANEYRKAGDVERAIQICQEHLPQQPGHMSGHIVFGQALFESRQFDEARRVFQAALALDPENLIALRHLGDIARDEGDVGGAREWYQRVLDADPRNEDIAAQIAALPTAGAVATDSGFAGNGRSPSEAGAPTATIEELTTADTAEHTTSESGGTAGAEDKGAERAAPPPPEEIAPVDFTNDVFGARDAEPARSEGPDALRIERAGVETNAADEPADLDLDLSSLDAAPAQAAEFIDLPSSAPSANVGSPHDAHDAFPSLDLDRSEEPPRGEETVPRAAVDADGLNGPALELDSAHDLGPLPDTTTEGETAAGAPASAEARGDDDSSGTEFEVVDESPDDAGATALPWLDEAAPRDASPTAGAPTAAAASSGIGDKPLGLESMEFVPPSRDEESDPTQGHLLRDDVPPAATPPAFVTETMAELYLQQGFRDEALGVYRQLLANNPNDENLRERVAQLESGSRSSVGAAGISDAVIEAAHQRQTAPAPAPTARAFFASLAGRRPSAPRVEAHAAADSDDWPAAPALEGERRYDDFGFPIGAEEVIGTQRAGTDVTGSAAGSQVAAREADEAVDDVLDALPPQAAIEPATLDYAADLAAAAPAAPGANGVARADADAEAFPSFEATTAEPLTGDRYGAIDESGEAASGEAPPRPATGPVDSLFAGPSDEEDAAAATLAGAFGSTSPSNRAVTGADRAVRGSTAPDMPPVGGRPGAATPSAHTDPERATRPAASELSLDHVFRDTPRRSSGQRRQSPAFSFDQFFAEAATPAEPGESAQSAPAGANEGGAEGASADIEQFNAWLEGLKKK